MKITEIVVHDDYDWIKEGKTTPASITIDDAWVIQRGTDGEWSIPASHHAYAQDPELQDLVREQLDADQIAEELNLNDLLKK